MTSYLIDTNVLSETRRKTGNSEVKSFFASLPPEQVYFSVLTLGEIRRGAIRQKRKDPSFNNELMSWLAQIESSAAGRILPVTLAIAYRWADLTVDRTRSPVDALLAATAAVHGLTVVTRNTVDFVDFGVPLINPWDA